MSSSKLAGKPVAQVYTGKALATNERFGGATVEEACNAAGAWIDTTRRAQIEARQVRHIGTVEEYVRFLSTHKVTEKQKKALVTHAAAPSRILSPAEIAVQAGWPDFNTTTLQYQLLGKSMADALELILPPFEGEPTTATNAIADSVDPNWRSTPSHFRWRMHEELAVALGRVDIR